MSRFSRFAPPIIRAEEQQREGDLEGAVVRNGYIVRLQDDDQWREDRERYIEHAKEERDAEIAEAVEAALAAPDEEIETVADVLDYAVRQTGCTRNAAMGELWRQTGKPEAEITEALERYEREGRSW